MNFSSFDAIATTFAGLEDVLAQEIRALGASKIEIITRGVRFSCSPELLYKANLWLRTALRILMPIHSFSARNEQELYDGVQLVEWRKYMDVNDTLAVESAINTEYFNHSKYVAQKTKDAIVDQFRSRSGSRPSVDLAAPTLRIHLHIFRNACTLSLDSSGDSLHRRGYRLEGREAPLNEVLAAGMILLSGWDAHTPFLDPCCGSGTLAIEAALMAKNAAPGILRERFGFMTWKNFKPDLWNKLNTEAKEMIHQPECPIYGKDIAEKTLWVAQENARRAQIGDAVTWSQADFTLEKAPKNAGWLVTNPPYGHRIQNDNTPALYKAMGDALKKEYSGWFAWILSANKEALKSIGLRPFKKMTLFNGALECRFLGYRMYDGSMKKSKQPGNDSSTERPADGAE